MKNILSISGLLLSSMFFAQVIINPGNKTSVSNPSVSLEFGDDARGLILPYVEGSAANTAVAGTFIMDPADKRVKLKLADGTWQNLSGSAQVTNSILSAPSTIQENATAQVIIGSTSITPAQVPGILVLSDPNKAMVLPKVPSPHLNIKNPSPGMIVYDSAEKMLAVFNGTQWAFWKP
jgi:hypothetical protein